MNRVDEAVAVLQRADSEEEAVSVRVSSLNECNLNASWWLMKELIAYFEGEGCCIHQQH